MIYIFPVKEDNIRRKITDIIVTFNVFRKIFVLVFSLNDISFSLLYT